MTDDERDWILFVSGVGVCNGLLGLVQREQGNAS